MSFNLSLMYTYSNFYRKQHHMFTSRFIAALFEITKYQRSHVHNGCGSHHELLIAKFRLKVKKVEKTTTPFRYDLNQIPYDSGSEK